MVKVRIRMRVVEDADLVEYIEKGNVTKEK